MRHGAADECAVHHAIKMNIRATRRNSRLSSLRNGGAGNCRIAVIPYAIVDSGVRCRPFALKLSGEASFRTWPFALAIRGQAWRTRRCRDCGPSESCVGEKYLRRKTQDGKETSRDVRCLAYAGARSTSPAGPANLVERRPHQSAVVAKITPSKMVEMFEVMAEPEGFCGRLAARRMTPLEHKMLIAIHKKFRPFVDARDREGYHDLNKSFHEAIYAGSHNEYLREQAIALYGRLAIVAGNGDEAQRLLVDHVSLGNELFADLIAALNSAEGE
jgi:hypothetical protein